MALKETRNSDFIIIGGGSAAFAAAIRASELGAHVTMINEGLPIGGTCVNVGCVPSKTLIRAAEVQHRALNHHFSGIESQSQVTDFRAVVAQKRQLVEELQQEKYINVIEESPNVRLIKGRGHLVGPNSMEVNGEKMAISESLN
jgi:mercuric reductase